MKKLLFLISLVASGVSYAVDYSQDSGIISSVYTTPSGSIAFKLENGRLGIPNAVTKFSCTSGSGWIRNSGSQPAFISAILAAKTAGNNVTVTVNGCDGGFFQVMDMYIN